MIHKIENIKSIGKFRDYSAAGTVNFHKLTLIYGDNGSGKTTLTAILRSLTNNAPEIINSRKTINSTIPQSAQITEVGSPRVFHTFGTNGWTAALDGIEIFDIHFVNENIYSGFAFNDEHKKHLHQFVVGAMGVGIQQRIDQNKLDKATSRQYQESLEQQLIRSVGNGLTLDLITSFLKIHPSLAINIDDQIAEAQAALASANAVSILQTLPILKQQIPLPPEIDFLTIKNHLATSSQLIQDEMLNSLFEEHCEGLSEKSIEGPELWLKTGFEYLKLKKSNGANEQSQQKYCPFCKQSVSDTLDIVKAYTQKFNDEFNKLVEEVESDLHELRTKNYANLSQSIVSVNQENISCVASWQPHLPNSIQAPSKTIIGDETDLAVKLQSTISLVEEKLQNPSIALSTEPVDEFVALIEVINTAIIDYNKEVLHYNTGIESFKLAIKPADQVQKTLDELQQIKNRYDPAVSAICTQLTSERQKLRILERAYSSLAQQQESAATVFFSQYRDRINHYLDSEFKTPFKVEDVIHIPPRGRAAHPKISYKLTIDGSDISFIDDEPNCARDCLSEGDRSTIALAFFLSKLDIDPNTNDKILVFDDPLSSLDTKRRSYTIGIIRSLLPRMEQVVVLSHNEYFLAEIARDINSSHMKALRITENFVNKASAIETCDIDDLVKNTYFKQIESLESFRTNPDLTLKDSVLGWLRKVLESHIRFKFYLQVRNMSGHKTFGRLINYLESNNVLFRINANRDAIINKLRLVNGVSWSMHHGDPTPDYSALGLNPNTITAAELDNIIVDTLDLIENQL